MPALSSNPSCARSSREVPASTSAPAWISPPVPVRAFALFAHCFTCTKDILAARRIAATLAANGLGVLRFDFTGLGSSEGEFANTNFSSNVEDLVRAAHYLRDNLRRAGHPDRPLAWGGCRVGRGSRHSRGEGGRHHRSARRRRSCARALRQLSRSDPRDGRGARWSLPAASSLSGAPSSRTPKDTGWPIASARSARPSSSCTPRWTRWSESTMPTRIFQAAKHPEELHLARWRGPSAVRWRCGRLCRRA